MADVMMAPRSLSTQRLVGELSPQDGFVLRRVSRRADWERVRRLRFETLARRGDVPPAPDGGFGDAHDNALNAVTFMLAAGERLVGSTRSSVSSARRRWPLPAHEAFAAELERAMAPDDTIVEASLMVVDGEAADAKVALIHLFRAHMLHCAAEDADWLITAVRDSQIGFFRRMFGMEILSGAEPVRGLAMPRVLMGLAYREQASLLAKRIPVLATSAEDEREFALALAA